MASRPTYKRVEVGQPFRLRGTNQQTNDALAFRLPTYRVHGTGVPPTAGFDVPMVGITVAHAEIQNRSGTATAPWGLCGRIPNRYWIAGFWTDAAGTPFVDDTADAQSTAATDFPMETATTANNGFVIASTVPFGVVSLNVITAGVDGGATRVHAIRTSNLAGSGWNAALAAGEYLVLDGAAAVNAAGENILAFNPPLNWGRTQVGGLSGIPGGYYALNFRATTPCDTTAAVASSIEIFESAFMTEVLADNGALVIAPMEPLLFEFSDAIVPFCGTLGIGNRLSLQVRAA